LVLRSILLRLLGAVPVLLLVTFGIFSLLHLAPGDAATAMAAEDATEADVARLRQQWGLDKPLPVQFLLFLYNVLRLDFGISFRYVEPVTNLLSVRLPATIELALLALLFAIIIAVPLGIMMALHKGRLLDGIGSLFAIAGVSAPHFWVGILLVLFLSSHLNLLPSSGRLPYGVELKTQTGFVLIDSLIQGQFQTFWIGFMHLVQPALTLALGMTGIIARVTRSAIIDVGQEEFVFSAAAKGLTKGEIVRRHLLPNAAIPITTIIGLELGMLISGSIVVEVVFSWPGLGSLLYQAVTVRDIPLTMGIVVTYTTLFIVMNILVDVAYIVIDPRLRAGKTI
jgi:ABC-type dipeptide/oligopeptide/nickel transport system permease component